MGMQARKICMNMLAYCNNKIPQLFLSQSLMLHPEHSSGYSHPFFSKEKKCRYIQVCVCVHAYVYNLNTILAIYRGVRYRGGT